MAAEAVLPKQKCSDVTKNMIPVVFSCDDNYVQHLYCAINSIVKSKDESDDIIVFVMIDKMTESNKNNLFKFCLKNNVHLKFLEINKDTFKNCPMTLFCPHITIATYYRFVLSSLLPDYDKVIYLDCDVTVQGSLKELYETDIEEYYFAAVKDILYDSSSTRMGLEKYCNAGIMLINLKRWREEGIENRLFSWAAENYKTIKWQDQDVLNYVLQDKILYLDKKWNCQVGQYDLCEELGFNDMVKEASILHYIGYAKPWRDCCRANLKIKMPYFKSLIGTPYAWLFPIYFIMPIWVFIRHYTKKIIILTYIKIHE